MLLAAELALLAIDPASGRHALGIRDKLNACLAGLLVGELVLGGHAEPGERDGTVVLTDDPAADPVLVATAQVVAVRGPKLKAVMSSMDRSLGKRLGTGTWDSVVATLVAGHVLANLLELVAPDRHTRKHARRRIDHALDESSRRDIGGVVRKLLTEAATAAAAAATAATVAAANG